MTANPNLAPASRADRAREAARLKAQGLNGLEIAARMGIGKSFAYSLLNDPDGTGERERKRRHGGTCASCGSPTAYNTGAAAVFCRACLSVLPPSRPLYGPGPECFIHWPEAQRQNTETALTNIVALMREWGIAA